MPNVFPILINWTSPFPILGLLGGVFLFKISFCLQTVKNLIRRRVLRRLIWFCTGLALFADVPQNFQICSIILEIWLSFLGRCLTHSCLISVRQSHDFSQLMRLCCSSLVRRTKAQTSLCIRTFSPEPSLLRHAMKALPGYTHTVYIVSQLKEFNLSISFILC